LDPAESVGHAASAGKNEASKFEEMTAFGICIDKSESFERTLSAGSADKSDYDG
jgi:hypothetical protein